MSRSAIIALLYVAFAVISTAVNLSFQWLSLQLYKGQMSLVVGMLLGTSTGLISKYFLDKNWIFNQRGNSPARHLREFSGYALTGVATTALFWVCELTFNAIDPAWRFLGAALGLAIGYAAKYRLDQRFVFGASP